MKKLLILFLSVISLLCYAQDYEVDNVYVRQKVYFGTDPLDWNILLDSINKKVSEGAFIQPVDSLSLNKNVVNTGFYEWTFKVDTANGTITMFTGESEVSNQLGQEVWLYGYNNTGSTLNNFEVVYEDSSNYTPRGFKRAIAGDKFATRRTMLVVTHDIEAGTKGYATKFGDLLGNTSSWDLNDELYLSYIDSGQIVNYPPPIGYGYPIPIGFVKKVGVSDGVITVDVNRYTGLETGIASEGIFNGIIIKKPGIYDTVFGGTVYFETNYESDTTMDLPFMYSGIIYQLNTTTNTGRYGRARIALSSGTSTNPQSNYIYIDYNSGSPQLAVSTTAYPNDAVRLAECGVFDITTHGTYGFAYFHRFNNELDDSNADGWISKASKRIRLEGSRYESPGIDPTVTIVTNGSGRDSLNVYTTAGVIWQFNRQTFQAQTQKKYYWFNCPSGGKWIDDLHDVDSTADGQSLRGVNFKYGLNIFAVQSSGSFNDFLLVAAPTGYYSITADAINDVNNYAVTSVPFMWSKTAIRLFRIVVNYTTSSSGTITNLLGTGGYQDERGQLLGIGGGGSGSGAAITNFSDANFTIYDNSDVTKIIQFQANGITTGTTRTMTVPDKNGTIAMTDDLFTTSDEIDPVYTADSSKYVEWNDTLPSGKIATKDDLINNTFLNGLTLSNDTVRLGGAFTSNINISSSDGHTFFVDVYSGDDEATLFIDELSTSIGVENLNGGASIGSGNSSSYFSNTFGISQLSGDYNISQDSTGLYQSGTIGSAASWTDSHFITKGFADTSYSGISNVVEDLTPQLGGDLQSNGNNINIESGDTLKLIQGAEWGGLFYDSNGDLQIYESISNNRIDIGGSDDDRMYIWATSGVYIEESGHSLRLTANRIYSSDNITQIDDSVTISGYLMVGGKLSARSVKIGALGDTITGITDYPTGDSTVFEINSTEQRVMYAPGVVGGGGLTQPQVSAIVSDSLTAEASKARTLTNHTIDYNNNNILNLPSSSMTAAQMNDSLKLENLDISFTTSIPFDYKKTTVAAHTLTTNTTLTPNPTGAVDLNTTTYKVTGANNYTLGFSGMYLFDGSPYSSFDTTAGVVNIITCFRVAPRYYYSILDQYVADITAPLYVSSNIGVVNDSTIRIVYNENLDETSVPATTDFSTTGITGSPTVNSVGVSGTNVDLTLSASTGLSTDNITVSYIPGTNKIRDVSFNNAAAITDSSVTNNIGGLLVRKLKNVTFADAANLWVDSVSTNDAELWGLMAGGDGGLGRHITCPNTNVANKFVDEIVFKAKVIIPESSSGFALAIDKSVNDFQVRLQRQSGSTAKVEVYWGDNLVSTSQGQAIQTNGLADGLVHAIEIKLKKTTGVVQYWEDGDSITSFTKTVVTAAQTTNQFRLYSYYGSNFGNPCHLSDVQIWSSLNKEADSLFFYCPDPFVPIDVTGTNTLTKTGAITTGWYADGSVYNTRYGYSMRTKAASDTIYVPYDLNGDTITYAHPTGYANAGYWPASANKLNIFGFVDMNPAQSVDAIFDLWDRSDATYWSGLTIHNGNNFLWPVYELNSTFWDAQMQSARSKISITEETKLVSNLEQTE